MANPMISFKKGLRQNLPATHSEGTFYVTTDERAIYLDVSDSARIRLGDFQEFASVAALEANANPSTTALYFVSDINCLAKWTGAEYVQINRDTGMTSVEVVGEGNAVTAAVYNAEGRKLTLTKGATYMTAADVDSKIAAKVGAIEGTVKAYVDAKTEGIATDAALSELQGRVDTAEADIKNLQDANKEGGDVALAIADAKKAGTDAQDAAEAAQATADSKATLDEVKDLGYQTAEQVQAIADGKDASIKEAKDRADEAYTLASGKATMTEVNAAIADAGHAVATEVEASFAAMEESYVAADTALETKLNTEIGKKVDKTTYDEKVAALEEAIADEKERAEGIEGDLEERLAAVEEDHLTSADKEALQTQINTIMNNPDAEGAINSINEFTQYVKDHGEIAEGFRTDINTNKEDIADLAEVDEAAGRTAVYSLCHRPSL